MSVKDTASFDFTFCERLDDLLHHARTRHFDLCILFLQNVLASEGANENRIEKTIGAIQTVKAGRLVKVIALSGYCPNLEFPDRVCRAGADHFLLLPLNSVEFEKAVAQCLSPLVGQSSAD